MGVRGPRLLLVIAAAAVALGAGPEYDVPGVLLTGDVSRVGHIDLVANAAPADLRIVEDVGETTVDVPSTQTGSYRMADVHWTCEETTRTFRAIADGHSSAPYVAQTPGCDTRLRFVVPTEVRRGANLRVKFRDLWRIGDTWVLLCVQPPGTAPRSCEDVEIPDGQFLANHVVPARTAGTWSVTIDSNYQHFSQAVTVRRGRGPRAKLPSILTTGDSLMLTPTAALRRSTAGRAEVIEDVYPSAGLQKPFVVNWRTLPAKQVHAYHEDATVLTLGISDGRPIATPSGELECCSEAWIAAYAQRAHRVMRTYAQGGSAAVVWLNIPYPRDAPAGFVSRINRALALAARGLERVEVLDIAAIFTPGRTFRQTMRWHGRLVKVRDNDGVHLTPAGARIAVSQIRPALRRLGVRT